MQKKRKLVKRIATAKAPKVSRSDVHAALRAYRILREADIDVVRIVPALQHLAVAARKKAGDRPTLGDRGDFGTLKDGSDRRDRSDGSVPDWTDGK